MAGKKPAKVNAGNKVNQKELPGKATMYITGYKGGFHTCPTCGKKTGKGILYELNNELYCSRGCLKQLVSIA